MITVSKRTTKFTELKPYDYFAKDEDFIEVTEWVNGEGFDVSIHSLGQQKNFLLTHGEFQALVALINYRGEND
jgi:hypothetical protein